MVKISVLIDNGLIELLRMKFGILLMKNENGIWVNQSESDKPKQTFEIYESPWDGYKLHTKVSDWMEANNIGKVTLEGIEFENEEDMLQFQMKWLTKW